MKGTQIKFILIASLILVVLATVIAVVTMNVRRANMLKSNPELAKAMTYNEVKEGEEKGRKEGQKEEKISIAKKLLKENVELRTIAITTGLTEEQIKELAKDK